MMDVVVLDLLRARGEAVATLIGRDGVEAGLCNRGDLVAPRIAELWKAVAEEDGLTFAFLVHRHANAIGVDITGRAPCHGHAVLHINSVVRRVDRWRRCASSVALPLSLVMVREGGPPTSRSRPDVGKSWVVRLRGP